MIHLDTAFLVDLLREGRHGQGGPATRQLEYLAEAELRVSVHALCELFAGVGLSTRPLEERHTVEVLTAGLNVVYPTAGFAATYGRLLAHLKSAGTLIATMDLLIGTAALVDRAPSPPAT